MTEIAPANGKPKILDNHCQPLTSRPDMNDETEAVD